MADPRYSLFAARAVFDPRLTATDVRVLAALGTYTNKQGWCNPKQATIAMRVGVSRTTVTAAMKRLLETGYLEVKPQVIAGRGQTANNYRVILDLDPVSAWTTPDPDVSEDDSPMSAQTTGGVVPVGHPPSNQDDTQKEHSQLNIPRKEEESARASDDVTSSMLDALKLRAEGAINLANANVHHAGALRQLMREGCTWQDIEDATDAVSGSIRARKGRPFFSWGVIRESALANRDRRAQPLAPMAEPKPQRPGKASYSEIIQRVGKEFGH